MKDDNFGEDRDPLLVRPYLLHDSGTAAADEESSPTWPAAATPEVRSHRALGSADEPTVVLALPAAPERSHARPVRRRIILLSVVGAVVLLVAGVAGLAALRNGAPPVSALPAEPLPAATGPQPTSAKATTATGAAATTTAATPTTATAGSKTGPAATRTTGAAASPTKTSPNGQTSVKPAVPAGQGSATDDSPTGTIRGQNGVCLDGGGHFGSDRVQVDRCDGSDSQIFTLAADGTLQVDGRCAQTYGDATVHIGSCGSRSTSKWRTSGQLLINTENDGCLTDPSSGSHSGSWAMVLPCGGSARQRWSLP